MGAQCAMAANSSLLGSVCNLLIVWVALRDLGDNPFWWMLGSDLMAISNLGCRQVCGVPLESTVARVHIGQVIMSIHIKLQNKEHVTEALNRTKFRFPGRQKIHISKKWGFTKFNADEFEDVMAEKQLIPDGCGVKYIPNHGPLDKWRALHS
ncbi:large ribosomal subunit protein uL16-like [Mustela nigripes]|uniref:large ribosomal subunit protein uL16-like n=1 Tax=Mustela nigripes TaxID=77151 RepID=UPI002815609A|nr:large ribosomal subunit protein uL16-like [Mustela nigripes]